MIIALLVLIFLAVLFPGFVRGVVLLCCLGVGYVLFAPSEHDTRSAVGAAEAQSPSTPTSTGNIIQVAVSERLPAYDVDGECLEKMGPVADNAAKGMGVAKDKILNVYMNKCVREEQVEYDRLASIWEEVPDLIKSECVSKSTNPSFYKYFQLRNCVESRYSFDQNHRERFKP